jgi:hypothetical protein
MTLVASDVYVLAQQWIFCLGVIELPIDRDSLPGNSGVT